MGEKEIAKMMLTAGITIGLAGAIAKTPSGDTIARLGLILIALAIILFPRGLVEVFYEYLFGAEHEELKVFYEYLFGVEYEELLEEGRADDGKRRGEDL